MIKPSYVVVKASLYERDGKRVEKYSAYFLVINYSALALPLNSKRHHVIETGGQ